jgi:Family of unknown function (DUF6502)
MATTERVLAAVSRILRPLVRMLVRNGVPADALTEVVRKTYVDVADQDFQLGGKRQTVARISVLTGLHRKEVARLRGLDSLEISVEASRRNRAATVISAWLRDVDFLDRKGDPRDLSFSGDNSFSELVRRYSGDMKPRAMADELLASGAIEEVDGRLRMSSRGYVPGTDPAEMVAVLGTDPVQLIETIDHNMQHAERLYQRKVEYDNVPDEYATEFRALSARLAQHLLEELDRWLAARDLGRKSSRKPTLTLGLGIYQIQGSGRNPADTARKTKEQGKDGD